MRLLCPLLLAICIPILSPVYALEKLAIAPDKATGIYEVGEKVTWTIQSAGYPSAKTSDFQYEVLSGGLKQLEKGKVEWDSEGNFRVTATRKEPGTILLTVSWKNKDGKESKQYGGAVFNPEKIQGSAKGPDDFDQFWKDKIAELNEVPMEVKMERKDIGDDKIEYYKIEMNNIRGRKIYGQLAKPIGGKNLPALLQVQWAGVYPLNPDWIRWHARNGWLALNISAHNLPIDKPEDFYSKMASTELNDYPGQGNDNRETAYFLPMFLSCRRAVDYLIKHEDWNGKTVVVHGGSQGGYQAIVTAGIHPSVTGMAANVPAGCDHTGKQVGRAPGWPNWASRTWQGKDESKMIATSKYFDALHFATRSKCSDSLVGVGLVDTVCPAEGVIATYNSLPGQKEIVVMPQADHSGDHKVYSESFNQFLERMKK